MANIVLVMSGDEAKLWRSVQKIIRQQQDMENSFKKTGKAGRAAGDQMGAGLKNAAGAAQRAGRQFKDAGDHGKKAFGATALAGLKSYAAGMLSIGVGVGTVKKALEEMEQVRVAAGERVSVAAEPLSQLAQLAGGDKTKLGTLLAAVRASREEGGYTAQQAAALQFTLESLGEGKNRAFFAGFRHITDPTKLAEGAATLKAAFGEKEAGTTREIVNKLLAASAVSKTTVEQFAPAATIAAQTSREIGASDEELLGSMAILSRATKSADVAATEIAALSKTIIEKGLGGQGLLAAMDKIGQETKGLTGEELTGYFGRLEGFKAFRALQLNRTEIERTIADVEREGLMRPGEGLSARMKRSLAAFPELTTPPFAAVRREQRELLEEKQLGPMNLVAQGIQDELLADLRKKGRSDLKIWAADKLFRMRRWMGGDEAFVQEFAPFASPGTQQEIKPRLQQLEKSAERMEAAAGALERTADVLNRGFAGPLAAWKQMWVRPSPGGTTLARPDQDR